MAASLRSLPQKTVQKDPDADHDPQDSQNLANPGRSGNAPFMDGFNSDIDSDIELDIDEVIDDDCLQVQENSEPIFCDLQNASFPQPEMQENSEPVLCNLQNASCPQTEDGAVGHNDEIPPSGECGWWKAGVTRFPKFRFSKRTGLQANVTGDSPIDFFKLMVTDELMESITYETNKYAAETLQDKELTPHSRFHKWVDVTVEEMWVFFGLTIWMGLIKIDDLDNYWTTDTAYSLPMARTVMTRDRFVLILGFLYVADNAEQLPKDDPEHDPLFKIRKFAESLMQNFQQAYLPGKNVTIDQAMVPWRGPLSVRATGNDKSANYGIKVFKLCDSSNGYCCNLEFYTEEREASEHGTSFYVVNRLMEPYVGCGRTLFVDGQYTSPELFCHLRQQSTMACGTIWLRKFPRIKKMIAASKTSSSAWTNGNLNLFHYDHGPKRERAILTTIYDDTEITTSKTDAVNKEPSRKLHAEVDYNMFKGAVDRSDLMVSNSTFNYSPDQWWRKSLFHLFMLAVLNSYILHKLTVTANKKLSYSVFRRELIKQLIQKAPVISQAPKVPEVGGSALFRLTARHFPSLITKRGPGKPDNPQRTCVVCSVGRLRKHSRYECTSCDVGLHPQPCFEIYHTEEDYKNAVKRCLKRKHEQQ